jgi:hypothetical protein
LEANCVACLHAYADRLVDPIADSLAYQYTHHDAHGDSDEYSYKFGHRRWRIGLLGHQQPRRRC